MDHRPFTTRQHPLDTSPNDANVDNNNALTTLPQANPHYIPHASTRIPQDFNPIPIHPTTNNFIPGQSLKHNFQPTAVTLRSPITNLQNSWLNGYNGGSLDQPGMRFYDSNIQPTIAPSTNNISIIHTNEHNNHIPISQPTSLLYQSSNNFSSTPNKPNSQTLLPINSNILPPTNNVNTTTTTATTQITSNFNLQQADIPLSQAMQYRQLPSMSTLIGNKPSNQSHGIVTEQSVDFTPTTNSSQLSNYRRSLPPMAHITGVSNQVYIPNTHLKTDYSRSRSPSPIDSTIKQAGGTTMRQLPIITPYGPKPIHRPSHRPPLRDINQASQLRPQPRPRISIQPSSINMPQGSGFPHVAKENTIECKLPEDTRHSSKNDFPAGFQSQLPSTNDVVQASSNNRLSTQTINNTSQRQLPIITKQGVLRLRDNSFLADSENSLPQSSKQSSRSYNIPSSMMNSPNLDKYSKLRGTGQDIRIDSKQRRLSNLTDSDNDYYEDEYEHQDDLDTGDEDRVSDDSAKESDEIVSSMKSENDLEHDEMMNDFDNETTMTDQEREAINIYVNGDELIEEHEEYHDDSKGVEELDEEGEYFSALATVPEEEGKLSDKDNFEYDQQFEEEPAIKEIEESSVRSSEISVSTNKKLPTIIENGFEAQVLEYIVEKTGMRRGELFSVDEEPSSYNDEEADSGSMESRTDNIRQEDLDLSDNRLPILQDNSYPAKVTDDAKVDFGNQQTEQIVDSELKSIHDTIQNDSMIQDLVDDFTGSEESKFNRYNQQQVDLNRDSSISDGKKADYGEYDDIKQNLNDSNEVALSVTNYDNNNKILETGQNDQTMDDKVTNLNTDFIPTQDHDQQAIIGLNEQQFYTDQKVSDYDLAEEDEDERILMSPNTNNKTSFEQEEYDEQYRDINNLDDLDRRATNHVHAIDGHSKSMLNDIHQQRTIVDYYDENDYAMNNNNYDETNNNLEAERAYDSRQENDDGEIYHKQDFQSEQTEEKDYADVEHDDDDDDQEEHIEKEDDEGLKDDFDPDLPRARVRWITAVNKIVNRFGEVSYNFLTRSKFRSICSVFVVSSISLKDSFPLFYDVSCIFEVVILFSKQLQSLHEI